MGSSMTPTSDKCGHTDSILICAMFMIGPMDSVQVDTSAPQQSLKPSGYGGNAMPGARRRPCKRGFRFIKDYQKRVYP